ncbi:glycosyl transferase [Puniceibacterium antarcticum]|uniref:Glycosyl transferase n=1 Tax=Puniceibacterium antarcticum TaxID=1206336 RepID=A0A2G8RAK1_9RHOB|nr:glycosyl transferase [Puniceibacterium antarcticum]PIL18580.1 glycosyl transferase [Puniceibacterium antarcticum]
MVANIICIKWGTLFGPEYVNRLYSGVRRNLSVPVRFFCMTEQADGLHPEIEVLPLPEEPFQEPMNAALAVANRQGAMRKTSLFRRGLVRDLEGPFLGFDLDVVITGSLDPLLALEPGKVAMRHDWVEKRKGRPTGHGSVFRFDPEVHGYLYDDLAANPYKEVETARGSEQRYTSHKAMDRGEFVYIPEPWVVSFKYDCNPFPGNYIRKPQLPDDARVVCFHGHPKMPEAIEGYGKSLIRYSKPCDWLQDHWVARATADLGAQFA